MVLAGGMLIFHGDLGDWGKRMSYLCLLGILLSANQLVPVLFPNTFAVIALGTH